jgi:peptidase S41-like protein
MRTTGLLLVPLAMVALAGSVQARPSVQSTAAADVRDLGAAIEQIHPNPFRSISKQRFEAEVDDLARRAASISRDELLVGVLRIIASLGPRNGHTGLFPGDPGNVRPLHLYPIRLYRFADGVFVVDARDKELVGARLVAIEGAPAERVFQLVDPLVPHDNASNVRGMAPHYVLTAEVLHGLGIAATAGPARFTLERAGRREDVTLAPIPGPEYAGAFADPLHGHYPSVLPSATRPLYLANSGKELWARTLAGGRGVYVGYNAVVRPAPALVRRIERLAHASSTRRVIVDVRLNGGGDNTTYGPLLDVLASRQLNRRGRLYLLTGRATFSAAANFAAEIDRDTQALIVGEPTGGGVETYGDTVPLLLPSLGWYVYIAARYHERKRAANDHRLAVSPDVRVELTSAQYFAGQDPVLERALKGL